MDRRPWRSTVDGHEPGGGRRNPIERICGKGLVKHERIRVLHVLWTSQFGGITMGVRDLINAIDADRYEIGVCVLADGDLDLAPLLQRPTRIDALHFASGFDLVSAWRFCRLLRATPCDVVHSHTPSPLSTLALAICRPRTPRIFHEHGSVMKRRGSWRTRLSYWCVARLYNSFIAVSIPLVKDMIGAAIPRSRIRVIENAVDPGAAAAVWTRREARTRLGLDGDGSLVGTACRLVREKDLGLFLEVARRVREVRQDVRFVIAGAGPLAEELKQLARESGLEKAVAFLGPRTDMPVVWRAMDVFLFTSLTESFGRALLESQACMTPVVAPRQVAGGAAELVASSPGTLAVGSREPDELAREVLRLLASERLRDDMGRAGRDWVMRRFGVAAWVAKMQSLYDDLCGEAGARP
jgi:glycosyltransferase involved in cell wall biosynthesis